MEKPAVHVLAGKDRGDITSHALESMNLPELKDKRVVVKPNLVSTDNSLACTHPDTLESTLEFFTATNACEVIVAEGSFTSTVEVMRELGLNDICKRFGVEVVDLNRSDHTTISVVEPDFSPRLMRCASLPLEPDVFLVSLALIKTPVDRTGNHTRLGLNNTTFVWP